MNLGYLLPILGLSLLLPLETDSFAAPPASQDAAATSSTSPDFNGVESVVALIPKTVELKKSGKFNPLAAGLATDALKAGALGKSGQFKIKIKTIEAASPYGQKYRMVSDVDHVTIHGDRFNFTIYAYFTADQGEALTKLRPGSPTTILGTFVRSDLAPPDASDRLVLDLKDCQFVTAGTKSEPAAAAARPDLSTVEGVLALIPQNLPLETDGKLNPAAAAMASETMKAGTAGKIGLFKIKVGKVELANGYGEKFCLHAQPGQVLFRGNRIDDNVYAYFAAEAGVELAKLQPGTMVTVAGQFARTELGHFGKDDKMVVDLKDCRLVPAGSR